MRDDERLEGEFDDIEFRLTQVKTLGKMLRESATPQLKGLPQERSLGDYIPRLPRWPSGLDSDFDAVFGGFQAVTVLGGLPGAGKSQWAIACAMENALENDALVVYFDAENHDGEQRERIVRWWGAEPHYAAAYRQLSRFFSYALIDHTHNWETMMLFVAKQITSAHKRVLVILDSLQSIADEIEQDGGMLQVTARLYSMMNRLVRLSGGRISFLVLSELNKEGGMKGGAGGYRGTMVLRVDTAEEGEGFYKLSMLKNRNGRTPGEFGLYELDWQRCRFRKVQLT